jgi:hypothetical protein
MEYHKRKPDKETESLRIWKTDKKEHPKEAEELEKFKDEGIEIPYKDVKFKILDFNTARNPKTNELMFAWKFKHKEKLILIYNPSNTDVTPFLSIMQGLGFEIHDVMETLKNAYNEECMNLKSEEENSGEK